MWKRTCSGLLVCEGLGGESEQAGFVRIANHLLSIARLYDEELKQSARSGIANKDIA